MMYSLMMIIIISVADILFCIYLQRLNSFLRHACVNKIDCYFFATDIQSLNELICGNTTGGCAPEVFGDEKCCLSEILAFSLFHLSVLK